jgi:Domain of unknown function (DUF4145)
MTLNWNRVETMPSKQYICGYCGDDISSEKGWFGKNSSTARLVFVYLCHKCERPTFFNTDGLGQTPGAIFGNTVEGVEDDLVEKLYNEARRCTNNKSFTSAVLSCRKLLMHIAVAKGAMKDLNFIEYVEFLSEKNYIPPDAKDWVDHIRKKGNEANHEIVIMNEVDAKDLISFSEMLLKLIYEFPANIKKKAQQ